MSELQPVPITLNQAKVISIKLFRARLIDDLVGKFIKVTPQGDKGVNVPFDLDDLEVSSTAALNGTADVADHGLKAYENIKAGSASLNPLNWQNADETEYRNKLREYRKNFKQEYSVAIRKLVAAINDPNEFNNQIQEIDITSFTAIESITRDLSFDNSCTLRISLPEIRNPETTQSTEGKRWEVEKQIKENPRSVPRENDVIEIILQYPDKKYDRVFIGLVTITNQIVQRGEITAIAVTCHGISKMLLVNRMVTDRAIVSQFEDGETPQVGISPMAGGTFAEKTVDQIFTTIMASQLALSPTVRASKEVVLATEQTIAFNSLSVLEARIKELEKPLSKDTKVRVDRERKKKWDQVRAKVTKEVKLGFQSIRDIQAAIRPLVSKEFKPSLTAAERTDGELLLLVYLANDQLKRRLELITELIKAEKEKQEDPTDKSVNIDFSFDQDAFQDPDSLQMIYVPLITLMAVRNRENIDDFGNLVAKFSGRQARAYDFMLRKGFELFFSQLSTPNDVLDNIRKNAKFLVYENESNEVVCEIPQYNLFTYDESLGESIKDFIILNPQSVASTRQDVDLLTRVDMRGYAMLLGQLPFGTVTWGQFTDVLIMSKYGMRAEAPIYNPNTSFEPKSRVLFAALELAWRNSDTRSVTVEVQGDHQYKLGRLYFIAREDLDNVMGGPPEPQARSEPVRTNGYIGYLSRYETKIAHGAPIIHSLTFRFVRKAQLLPVQKDGQVISYIANFRVLPDLETMMDVLDELVRKGELDTGVFGRERLRKIPDSTVKILEMHGIRFYASDLVLRSDANNRWLGLNFMTNPAPGAAANLAYLTTSLGDTLHNNFPPNVAPEENIMTLGLNDTTEGLQLWLIRQLSALDLTVRGLNRVLFAAKNRPSFAKDLLLKNQMFRVIYIPTERINSSYRIAGLGGLRLTVINARDTQASIPDKVIESNDFPSPNGFLTQEDFSIAGGTPIRIHTDTDPQNDPTFVILKLHRRVSIEPAYTYTVSAAELHTTLIIQAIAAAAREATGGAIHQIDVENAIADLPTQDDEEYLPVVFHAPIRSNDIIENVDPGFQLSLFDSARLATFEFPGVTTIAKDSQGESKQRHAQGNAIDITLFPWYATTGVALKPHEPYIFSKTYDVYDTSRPGQLHDTMYRDLMNRPIEVNVVTKDESGLVETAVRRRLLEEVQRLQQIKKKNSPSQAAIAKAAFEKMLATLPTTEGTGTTYKIEDYMEFDDLHENDKYFYHVET